MVVRTEPTCSTSEMQTWRMALPKEETQRIIREVCISEAKEFLNVRVCPCDHFMHSLNNSVSPSRSPSRQGAVKPQGEENGKITDLAASYLKQPADRRTYKAMCDKRANALCQDLNLYGTKYKGWWDQTFAADARPTVQD